MEFCKVTKKYSISYEVTKHDAKFKSGGFGDINIYPSAVFSAVIERISDKEELTVTSLSSWESVEYDEERGRFVFSNPDGLGDIRFIISAVYDEDGISWFTEIENNSELYSVIWVNYPIPLVTSEKFDMFVPSCSGRAVKDVGNVGFKLKDMYPHHYSSMQYFAYYGENGGLYLGIHDENACMKNFVIDAHDKIASLAVEFPAIGAGRAKNDFALGGYIRWQFFEGDWYDATMIYADFVYKNAKWLPEMTEKGRLDLPKKLKDIAYWIVEYMPNSPEQRDVRPKKLGAVSHLYGKDYWFDAPIELQEKLGVPIGYHIYNWHNNPFNINYPHFTPKDEYFRGLKQLKGKNINVMPYINGVSWETDDADEGFEVNFENTGKYGAALDKHGKPITVSYPQKKENGEDTKLSPMCPLFPKWREIVNDLARKLENELDVDGIYFDEIAAHTPHPCRSEEHGHIPGGGSYWTDGYNSLMDNVNKNKKDDVFYVSESSGEPYMKSFDGYLTWLWRQSDDVPAFSAIYAGYIVMLGRFSDGIDKSDDRFFKENIAKGLLYGQQMGWIFADVVYDEKRTEFLKKYTRMRYKHRDTFACSRMLRPPKIRKNIDDIRGGAWKMRDGRKTVLFVTNISDSGREYELEFNNSEYKIDVNRLPEGAIADGENITVKGTIDANDCIDLTFYEI